MILDRLLTDAIITAARAHWGLGTAEITLVAARENAVYRVADAARPSALRLHRAGYRTTAELRSELQWMAMLAAQGIRVPNPIAATDGTQVMVCSDIVVDLLTWLDGAPLDAGTMTQQVFFDLGQLIAQTHDCADKWMLPDGFTRPTWDLVGDNPTWDRFWENPHLSRSQFAFFGAFRDHARVALRALKDPDLGLIHADLVPDNVMLHHGALQPIDFDDGGFGHRLFDLATVTFRSRRTDPTGALAQAVIAGYSARRTCDLDALPLFEALRACSYVGWNISRMAEDGAGNRNARFIKAAEVAVAAALTR